MSPNLSYVLGSHGCTKRADSGDNHLDLAASFRQLGIERVEILVQGVLRRGALLMIYTFDASK